MSGYPRLPVLSPVFTAVELAVLGSGGEVMELARRAATDRPCADSLRAAGRAGTPAEHTFVYRARDLEALWTA